MESNVLSVYGMNPNGILIYNLVSELFFEKLSKIQGATDVECTIKFKKIDVNLSENCRILLQNKCNSNISTTFSILLESIKEILLKLDDATRKKIESSLNIDAINLDPKNESGFIKKCKVYAELTQTIDVDLLKIDNCYSSIPIYFKFINSGEATSNCGLSEFSKALSYLGSDQTEKKEYYLYKFLNITLEKYIISFLTGLFIIILIYIIMILLNFKRNVSSIYCSRNNFINSGDNLLYIRKNPIFILNK